MSLTCKFHGGNTGATFSKIWGLNKELTSTQINDYLLSTYQPSWTKDTYLLIQFKNDLQAGNVSTSIGNLEKWLIYRKNQQENVLTFLTEKNIDIIEFNDYQVINSDVYEYYIFLQSSTTITNPSKSNAEQSLYYGWYLVDIEKNKAYQMDIEFNGGDLTYNEDYTEYEINKKTNIFTRGKNHYVEGDLQAVLSKDNLKEDVVDTNEELVAIREFIQSDRPKVLKSRRGQLFKVIVFDYQEVLLHNHIIENIYKVSFKFKEVGDV